MYVTGRDIMSQEAYREELRRQAEPWHLLRDKPRATNRVRSVYRKTMLRVGIGLESIGCWLKSRYSAPQVEVVFSSSPDGGLQSC